MANNTYVALDKKTVTSNVASIEFTTINQGYTDLVLIVNMQSSYTGDSGNGARLQFNNDTGTNYSDTNLRGSGSSALSYRLSNSNYIQAGLLPSSGGGTPANTLGAGIINIQNYSNTTTFKTVMSRTNSVYAVVEASVGLWRSTSAITSIKYFGDGDILAGSTFSLYGIRAEGLTPVPKATGGVISSDSTYMYHTFTSTGNFTPSQSLTCDYFIVAGGGGAGATVGGGWSGGGGGGGGYRTFSSVSFANGTAYTATIGAGGAGGSGSGGTGSVGSNTTLIGGAISTATSGGGGGGTSKENGNTQTNGTAGGSGGGAPQNTVNVSGGAGNSGGYTPVEGYAGFSNTTGGFAGTGQGGGAGGVGIAGTYLVEYPFNGVIAFNESPYSGGGGARWLTADNMNGIPNSGNGGYSKNDGTGTNYTGGTGGSGAVVIRYAKG
jgi:hypothetical protein